MTRSVTLSLRQLSFLLVIDQLSHFSNFVSIIMRSAVPFSGIIPTPCLFVCARQSSKWSQYLYLMCFYVFRCHALIVCAQNACVLILLIQCIRYQRSSVISEITIYWLKVCAFLPYCPPQTHLEQSEGSFPGTSI